MNEGWMKNDEGWMKDEQRMMNDEEWMMKDYDFKMLRGFDNRDRQTDICECRDAFATEKLSKCLQKLIRISVFHIKASFFVTWE